MSELCIVLGNQLFDYKCYSKLPQNIFMCEDYDLCTHYKYHKHKIIHFLSSMREYADYLKEKQKSLHYFKFEQKTQFFKKLKETLFSLNINSIVMYEVEDIFFEDKIIEFCREYNIKISFLQNPMFLCSRDEFKTYLNSTKKPLLNNFYIQMRKKHQILMENDYPLGGSWNFDSMNRKKIPKKMECPNFIPPALTSTHIEDVKKIVNSHFSDHPGECENYWIPTNRKDAITHFKSYLKERFMYFGDFQDALDERNPFLYHSLISPLMNIGFILPLEIIKEVEKYKDKVNLNSLEGFVRQILGWREFVRGIYQNFNSIQESKNHFNHTKKLTLDWYTGTTGIEPIDDVIKKANTWGYAHHIERLMVISNAMLLLEIHPSEVFKWFMEMFVDSSDWVMGPNVYGMGQFSDGGLFATKPYICGSNYIKKMGHYKDGPWCKELDGLYWGFINKNKDEFSKNPRMKMISTLYDKMSEQKKYDLKNAAANVRLRLTR